jgi:hypothetical protein
MKTFGMVLRLNYGYFVLLMAIETMYEYYKSGTDDAGKVPAK